MTSKLIPFLLVLMLNPTIGSRLVYAENAVKIQEITGRVELGEDAAYKLTKLKQGEILSVHAERISGNLDPLVILLKPGLEAKTVSAAYLTPLKKELSAGADPQVVIPEIFNQFSVIWNDDFQGNTAAFQTKIPEDGYYSLLVTSKLVGGTSGYFRLLVGLNAPEILTGHVEPTKDVFVYGAGPASLQDRDVQEITGALSGDKLSTFYDLGDIVVGETLHAFVEATSGDLKPIVTLYGINDQPLITVNYSGTRTSAALRRLVVRDPGNYRLEVSGQRPDGTVTTGAYHLVFGIQRVDPSSTVCVPCSRQ